ncbi:MAG TPA: acyltransferase family protein [Schlesneria sp.]|jgi:peptidoglycan/LPS O-acetylase OafA/YrhL
MNDFSARLSTTSHHSGQAEHSLHTASPFRRDIAGLRALAVIPVLLYHAGVPFLSGGFVGVDVFFVISGFLITTTMIKDLSQNQFSLATFYERRARRILPALMAVVLFCVWVGPSYLHAGTGESFAKSLIWLACFSSNIYFKQEFGYFDADAITKPLLHTWSLSIEEQFYLLFPILFAVLWKYSKQYVGIFVAGIALISFAISVRGVSNDQVSAFYFIQYRAWELALGSLLACANRPGISFRIPAGSRSSREVVAFLGLISILIPCHLYTKHTHFPGIAALPPCVGAVAIIWANSNAGTIVGRCLSIWPLTAIGAISYSLYLWHWPLLVFARLRHGEDLSVSANCIVLLISGVFACVSYWLIETPSRNRRFLPARKYVLSAATAVLVVFGATGFHLASPAHLALLADSSNAHLLDRPKGIKYPKSAVTDYFDVKEGIRVFRNGDPTKAGILLIGDSFANQWQNGLETFAAADNTTYYVQAVANCVPLIDTHIPYVDKQYKIPGKLRNASFGKLLDSVNVKHVILAGAWQHYVNDRPNVQELAALCTGDESSTTADQLQNMVTRKLADTIRFFNERGCKVWVLLEPPLYDFSVPLKLAALVRAKSPVSDSFMAKDEALRRRKTAVNLISAVVQKFGESEAAILDPFELFCSGDHCFTVHDNWSLYYDSMHLSYHGSVFGSKVFQPIAEHMNDSQLRPQPAGAESIEPIRAQTADRSTSLIR